VTAFFLLGQAAESPAATIVGRLGILQGYTSVFVVAFLVTLIATPLMRRLAVANGIIDRPSESRKVHRMPIAYLGGVAVFLGLMAGCLYSYLATVQSGLIDYHATKHVDPDHLPLTYVPISVILGMTVIMFVGLIDDWKGINPRYKIAGQFVAAAALAVENVGVKVAAGVMIPAANFMGIKTVVMGNAETIGFDIHIMGTTIPVDMVYWAGTAIIAAFVLGGCNASNLIDGLDGLLTGVTSIATGGLLVIALTLALVDDGPRDAQRLILCMALLGACMGFLPHNFNPATIFLGDAGSLLLGYCTVVIILTLGDTGKTHLVLAGLIIYAIPLIDTALAIVRRKLARQSISTADDQHLHHMLKRALGVKGAVLALYAIGLGFAVLGVAVSVVRARSIFALTMIFAAYIGVTAIKIARRKQIEDQAAAYDARVAAVRAGLGPTPVVPPAGVVPEPSPRSGKVLRSSSAGTPTAP
jgi:UDP-GlcNAc:undecaprenyl-phosphate/decaprenyl-phosphate GlcNAc-1-phosphate transferase